VKPAPFTYRCPSSPAEALAALAGDGAVALAGGQSLVPQLNSRQRRPSVVVDLNRLPGLAGVRELPGGGLSVGALTRLETLCHDDTVRRRLPVLAEAARLVAHPVIRHRATLGGSLCHADPAAELPAAALALDARLTLVSSAGTRTVPAAAPC
jgi:carbon-monoxide dehydrogenase medium subunit